MDYEWADRCEHVNFGLVYNHLLWPTTRLSHVSLCSSFTQVNGMSTRKGTAVFLEDILDEAKQVMAAKMAEVSTHIDRCLSHTHIRTHLY